MVGLLGLVGSMGVMAENPAPAKKGFFGRTKDQVLAQYSHKRLGMAAGAGAAWYAGKKTGVNDAVYHQIENVPGQFKNMTAPQWSLLGLASYCAYKLHRLDLDSQARHGKTLAAVEGVAAEVTGVKTSVDGINAAFAALPAGKMDELIGKVDGVDAKLDTLGAEQHAALRAKAGYSKDFEATWAANRIQAGLIEEEPAGVMNEKQAKVFLKAKKAEWKQQADAAAQAEAAKKIAEDAAQEHVSGFESEGGDD